MIFLSRQAIVHCSLMVVSGLFLRFDYFGGHLIKLVSSQPFQLGERNRALTCEVRLHFLQEPAGQWASEKNLGGKEGETTCAFSIPTKRLSAF